MTSGRPKRPAALAVTRSGTFTWWFSGAMADGIDTKEAHAVMKFLKTNHAALEKIDVHQLAAGQLMVGGSIDRNLQARLNRVDRLCATLEEDEPTPPAMRAYFKRKAKATPERVAERRANQQK